MARNRVVGRLGWLEVSQDGDERILESKVGDERESEM